MPHDWSEWALSQGEISQRLRGIADQWDKGLTEADPELLRQVYEGLADVKMDVRWAWEGAPPTPAEAAAAQADELSDRSAGK